MVDSVLGAGLAGINTGIRNAQEAAQTIARAGTTEAESSDTGTDLVEAIVDLKISEQQVKASAAVIRTADEIIGSIIDIKS